MNLQQIFKMLDNANYFNEMVGNKQYLLELTVREKSDPYPWILCKTSCYAQARKLIKEAYTYDNELLKVKFQKDPTTSSDFKTVLTVEQSEVTVEICFIQQY